MNKRQKLKIFERFQVNKMFTSKKALELSATMIVLIIITLVIFIGSIYFIQKFYLGAEEIKSEIERSTQAQIESLLRGGDLVAVPINKKTIRQGKSAVFGLGIRNILSAKDFYIKVVFDNAYDFLETPIEDKDFDYINSNWLLYDSSVFTLEQNKFRIMPISVSPDNYIGPGIQTKKGIYVFNICVLEDSLAECSVQGLRLSPESYYTEKIYQIFVEVD